MRRCPLCHSQDAAFFHQDKKRAFYACEHCGLIFADAGSHLPPAAEKHRYGRARANAKQRQLAQFILPLLSQLAQQQAGRLRGLNFGRVLDDASLSNLEAAGHTLKQYDPFFAPDHEALRQRYDFVCSYRVFEHFQDPLKEWSLISRLLNPGGWLAISTPLLTDLAGFAKWHYKNNLTHVSFYQRRTFEFLAQKGDFALLFAAKDLILMQKTSESGINRDPI
ncbi:class I SAM-dependent methyltransferase [Shewanella sp. AS16]|uniref:class I SAM-dependent methyltransferase n=1 Tax=Shewanella sp. AS16 TaxID=2907625 RepID=UPI001F3D9A27|nr:class I SAM-dependent methyltransferase [Shewanella sp. AS16]MCE9686205.1 class I SAM-dependent methyltransferase [Shewanella sp. AS16]